MHASFRVAGWGTLGFSIAFFVTFVVNAAINTLVHGPDLPTASDMAGDFLNGVIFVLLWGSAGIALVVAAVGLPAIVWPAETLTAKIATSFGVIAAAGWIFSGVNGLAQRTALLNGNIAAASADPAAERALVEGLYIGVHSGGILFAFAAAPWLAIVAVGAAQRRAMSRVAVAFLWVAALAPIAGFLILGAQWGFLAVVPAFAVVGASLLPRARHTVRGADAAASVPVATPSAAA